MMKINVENKYCLLSVQTISLLFKQFLTTGIIFPNNVVRDFKRNISNQNSIFETKIGVLTVNDTFQFRSDQNIFIKKCSACKYNKKFKILGPYLYF